ncbi:hypothetical protein F4815DRAFT_442970 [Daldinia loculata]|nr:hypothetical protein F4815DRAFT_442970 [Daldinia loculata]
MSTPHRFLSTLTKTNCLEEEINIVCGEPTDRAENGEESRRDSHCFPPEKETWIQKNKKAKHIGGWPLCTNLLRAAKSALTFSNGTALFGAAEMLGR